MHLLCVFVVWSPLLRNNEHLLNATTTNTVIATAAIVATRVDEAQAMRCAHIFQILTFHTKYINNKGNWSDFNSFFFFFFFDVACRKFIFHFLLFAFIFDYAARLKQWADTFNEQLLQILFGYFSGWKTLAKQKHRQLRAKAIKSLKIYTHIICQLQEMWNNWERVRYRTNKLTNIWCIQTLLCSQNRF